MAQELQAWQTLGGVHVGRSRDNHEASSTKVGHPIFAALYDPIGASMERRWMGGRRRRLLAGARGAVLEIGGGTGANLAHYRDVDRVTIAEPDPFMRSRIGPKLEDARVPVEVSAAGAEALPFPDGSFDTVVSTLVLCTVPDQEAAGRGQARPASGRTAAVYRARTRRWSHGPLAGPAGASGGGSSAAATPIETPSRPSRRPGSR